MGTMAKPAYRSSRNVVYSAKYHLVWCPKCQRQVLKGKIEVMPDHVHLFAEVDPSFGVSTLVRRLKGRSSRVLRQELPHLRRVPTLWTNSWFCATVGGVPLAAVKRYVESQKGA